MEQKTSIEPYFVNENPGNSANEQALEQKIAQLKEAISENNKVKIDQIINDFITVWNIDPASNQFYNTGLYNDFCELLGQNISLKSDIILNRENYKIITFVPPKYIQDLGGKFAQNQDPFLWDKFVDILIKEHCFEQLVALALVNNGSNFDKIQNALIMQHDDPESVLEFVKTYREQANINKISRSLSDYAGVLSRKTSQSARRKLRVVLNINTEIKAIGREVRAEQEELKIASQYRS